MNGGNLKFKMGNEADDKWGTAAEDRPYSRSLER
jgi:hypothetical protein